MALWLSGDLVAPPALARNIRRQLSCLRHQWAYEIEALQIRFQPPWGHQIMVKLTLEARDRMLRGDFPDLDSLNAIYEATEIDTHLLDTLCWVVITFPAQYHPGRLAEIYLAVPAVTAAEGEGFVGDYPNVYPSIHDGMTSYLVRNAWGDCPAGCIAEEFWYFRCWGDRCEYVGYYGGSGPEPEWWAEAEVALRRYFLRA